ncbi:MAG: Acriflavin resistance protein [uncultured bacterium (gcode 4)]|uniref:Acriflavin resistance protein n=1 Tax=uncultured bacterium (gcode 4) TaxID=1234023 RepID=K2G4Q4_9BACT|nr:MAG: Acriflavin resistance protein [uncultured bacterium (gcode 4)]
MFEKFTRFFLENEKITIVIITIIAVFWAWAYIMLPKQYNPSIVAPAFNVRIPLDWYTSEDSSQFVSRELENKIKELEWVDKIMSYSADNFSSTMVSFKVWTPQETAKIRLYDKIYGNYDLRPFWVKDVEIKSIDPEELPQVSFALTYNWSGLEVRESWIYLRKIALELKNGIKLVPNTTVLDIVWWYADSISVKLDKVKIESYNLDIWQVIRAVQASSSYRMVGESDDSKTRTLLMLDSGINDVSSLGNIIVAKINWADIFLKDLSIIKSWPVNLSKFYRYSSKESSRDAVFLWVAKMKWSNAVFVVEDVLKKVDEIKKKLPKNISLNIIQNEWETAKKATSELLFHLFVSIAVVLAILIIFLWLKNALNAAFCIPMVLGMVFITWLIFWLDINRITLFALILSLWILVDDSIVVVENNARHLEMMARTGKSKIEAVLDSVKEVGVSIVMSTVTRVMSFVAMFAVTGMMGDYMKPIPIFASIALIASLFIAFSINPYLATKFCKWDKCSGHSEHKESKFLKHYSNIISRFIDSTPKTRKSRKKLKLIFWISLGLIVILPISLGIFKARMLPKANKDQIYIWIDAPRDYSIQQTKAIEEKLSAFILNKDKWIPEELDLAENVSSTVWDRFLSDFANLFRWWSNRLSPNQISMRINLKSGEERDMKSEEYAIKIRPIIKNYIYGLYPDIKFRLLEDPPGPPTMATFHMKIKWQEDLSQTELTKFAETIKRTVKSIEEQEKLVDLSDTIGTPYKKIDIKLNQNDLIARWLSSDQVYNTLWALYNWIAVSFVHTKERTLEPSEIVIWFDDKETSDLNFLKNVYFTNASGEKVRLDEIATIRNEFANPEIYSDNRANTINIYSELGNNSVVYPVLKLYDMFWAKDFEKLGYRKIGSSPYSVDFVWIKDGKQYRVEWWWEWEITMDTFRDLWIAMMLSLLVIYFLIVAQFKSFQVGWIVMTTFLLSFFWIFPGFSFLYLLKWEYFTATAMIWAIALGWIVVGNAIILLDYIDQLIKEGKWLTYAVVEWSKKRFVPVMLTSIAAVFWSFVITADPVWSWLAWSIIWWLSASAILTLFFIPIFYYDYLVRYFSDASNEIQLQHIMENAPKTFDTAKAKNSK